MGYPAVIRLEEPSLPCSVERRDHRARRCEAGAARGRPLITTPPIATLDRGSLVVEPALLRLDPIQLAVTGAAIVGAPKAA